jgi:hypothetical protein
MHATDLFCYSPQNGVDSVARSTEKQISLDDVANKSKTSDLTEIVDPVHCRVVTLPETTDPTNKVFPILSLLKRVLFKRLYFYYI